MTGDNDFKTMVIDFFDIAARRDREIMAAIQDINAQIAALHAAVDGKTRAFADAMGSLKTAVNKALADLTAESAAGHSAMLGSIIAALKDVLTKIDGLDGADKLLVIESEITAAIAALPIPSVPRP